MARIRIEAIVEHLRTKMRRALQEAVNNCIEDAEFDEFELFRAFKRAVRRKCSTWERIPDVHVETSDE